MRILLQRVTTAHVDIGTETTGEIGRGYVLFVGVLKGDTAVEAAWLAEKISKIRLFDGLDGKINDRSILDIGGGALIVSQFTLAGKAEKGNRPDYTNAMGPLEAEKLYETFIACLRNEGIVAVETGRFGADMQVHLTNDGPVTLVLER